MTRYAMAIDLDRCVGCQACAVACKAENRVPDPLWRLSVQEQEGPGPQATVTFAHAQCFHCEQPACIDLCPTRATYQDDSGVVRLNGEACINCGYCVSSCPYGARHYDRNALSVQKCDFCAHRLAEGQLPACVAVCPTSARLFGDLDQPQSDLARAIAGPTASFFRPELGLRPKLAYLDKGGHAKDLAFAALPIRATTVPLVNLWHHVTRPLGLVGSGLATATTLLVFPAAWRNARLHEKGQAATTSTGKAQTTYPAALSSAASAPADASVGREMQSRQVAASGATDAQGCAAILSGEAGSDGSLAPKASDSAPPTQ